MVARQPSKLEEPVRIRSPACTNCNFFPPLGGNTRFAPSPRRRGGSRRIRASHGAWRSLVAHSAGGRAVAGSNPVAPIFPCISWESSEDHQEWMTLAHPAIAHPRRVQRQEVQNGCIGRSEQALGRAAQALGPREGGRGPRRPRRGTRPRPTSRPTATTRARSVSSRPRHCARRPKRDASGSQIGGPTCREAGTSASPGSAPTSSPARQSTTCTRPSAGPTGPRKRRGIAIDFAYSAVVEAEYAVLDAALARMEADDLSKEAAPAA